MPATRSNTSTKNAITPIRKIRLSLIAPLKDSEGLPKSDEYVCGLQSRNRVQISPDIDPDWPHGCLVAETRADYIAVIRPEMAKANGLVHVPTVVENHSSQAFLQWDREAPFGVNDKQLATSRGDCNSRRARRKVAGAGAQRRRCLGSSAVQGETSQAVGSPSKEPLADRNVTAGECFYQSQPEVIRPYHPGFHLAVERGLPEKTHSIVGGTERRRADSEIQGLIRSFVSIEGLIARIAQKRNGRTGGTHVLVFRRNEAENEQVGKGGALKGVA